MQKSEVSAWTFVEVRHPDKPVPDSQNERTCAQTEPDEDVPPSGFNTETPAGDLKRGHWTLRLNYLTSPCWPATSPPSASPAAKKRSVEPDVIGKTSCHFGKTRDRVHWKKSKMAISWEKKRLILKIFCGAAPDPAEGLTATMKIQCEENVRKKEKVRKFPHIFHTISSHFPHFFLTKISSH